jgi:hypothetical protein
VSQILTSGTSPESVGASPLSSSSSYTSSGEMKTSHTSVSVSRSGSRITTPDWEDEVLPPPPCTIAIPSQHSPRSHF